MWMAHGISLLSGWTLFFSLELWVLFLIWGVWFPSHLPLEGTEHIKNFGPYPVTHGTQGILPRQ
jgi:hypothetical protein